eukprot:INCI8156.1.p1 GENE.INCI8156.1~~INCI8156.1.p1  ORF type:complete len:207 (+),score=32.51 INCI8156.1:139-759(+)
MLSAEMRRIVFIVISAVHVLCAVGLFITGCTLLGHDIYGYGPGFFAFAEGIAALICFGWYVSMLRSSETNYDLVIGFSIGLILVFLQGCVLWGSLQQQVFEDLFKEKFVTAMGLAEHEDPSCTPCTDEELTDAAEIITSVNHNFPSERAAAGFSAIGLITQIALLAVVTLQKNSAGAVAAQSTASTHGVEDQSSSYGPEPIQEDDL